MAGESPLSPTRTGLGRLHLLDTAGNQELPVPKLPTD